MSTRGHKGLLCGILCKDLYAEEVRFNIKGENQVTSWPGRFLSFCMRVTVLVYMCERLLAFLSFDRFKITHYDAPLGLSGETSLYDSLNFNFQAQGFDFMIGFD